MHAPQYHITRPGWSLSIRTTARSSSEVERSDLLPEEERLVTIVELLLTRTPRPNEAHLGDEDAAGA